MGKFSVWWGLRVIQNPEIFEKFSPPHGVSTFPNSLEGGLRPVLGFSFGQAEQVKPKDSRTVDKISPAINWYFYK